MNLPTLIARTPGAPVSTDVGAPIEDAIVEVIGAAGGTLTDSDGRLTVEVPAGALSADTELSLQAITNTAPGGVGASFALRPEGLAFNAPVTLRFAFTDEDLEGSAPEFMRVAFQRSNQTWAVVPTDSIDTEAGEMTVHASHFSGWSRILEVSLEPRSTRVSVGDQRAFYVERCLLLESDEAGDVVDLNSCGKMSVSYAAANVSGWNVNGKAGGDSEVGTLSPDVETAYYEAPEQVPSPDVVTVGASVKNPATGQTIDISSSVKIVPSGYPPLYSGTFVYTSRHATGPNDFLDKHYEPQVPVPPDINRPS